MSGYIRLGQSIFKNGDRHVKRGLQHYAEGRPEFAEGSFAKALRNYERALTAAALFADRSIVQERAAAVLQSQVKRFHALQHAIQTRNMT